MLHAAYLIPLFPLIGFLILVSVGRRIGEKASGWIGTAAITAAFVATIVVFIGLLDAHSVTCSPGMGCPMITSGTLINDQFTQNLFTWIPAGALQVHAALLVDPLSITMCLFITGISALIHLYSTSYMHGDRDFTKFFVYLNLFVFSMLVLVLANNLLLTFVGWEGVGVCSYWLVSYYFDKDAAASAGKKAFIYNRIGDVGLLLAMFLLFSKVGTLDYIGIFSRAGQITPIVATCTVLALLLAAAGKSAQIPLFNWLPDAMEGPTPVSALIHAATMVTAGVYLLCRMNPILELSSTGRTVIALIGLATAFVAATIATSQQDIKKVLAFSTVSQIGYMILAVGTGAYIAAIFLMVAHAFFKALLFLGAGSVIHGLHGEQDLRRMGAIRKFMPITFVTFLIGWLAIAGVPPFAGFWSKGDVLTNVFSKSPVMWAFALVTALLTAYYMSRLFYLTFTGKARWSEPGKDGSPAHHEPHESDWRMTFPLIVLAILSTVGGIIDLPFVHHEGLATFLAPVFSTSLYEPHQSATLQLVLALIDATVAVAGIAIAWSLWKTGEERPSLTPRFFERVWFWDDFYDAIIGRPGTKLAVFSARVIDEKVIDGAVMGTAVAVRSTGSEVRKIQTGYVRHYAVAIVAGLLAIVAYLLSRSL